MASFPGGLLYFPGDSNSASLNPALNIAMLMLHYAPMATTTSRTSSYEASSILFALPFCLGVSSLTYNVLHSTQTFASSQLSYALGSNPMSVPYIVGINPNAPRNPHSAMASGGSDIGAIDTSPPIEAYVLYGAVVGGPDRNDKFWDIRCVEQKQD